MARVLRAQPGMEADVVAGGRVFHAEVAAVRLNHGESEVRLNLLAELEADPALPVTLVMAVYKFDRMEWVLEKATELGVAEIAPVIARRTEKHLAEAAEKRAERWRRIVHEAAKQSRRSDVPLIHDPGPLAARVKATARGTRIVLAEQERTTTLRSLIEEAAGSGGRGDAGVGDRDWAGRRMGAGRGSALRRERVEGGIAGSAHSARGDGGHCGAGGGGFVSGMRNFSGQRLP